MRVEAALPYPFRNASKAATSSLPTTCPLQSSAAPICAFDRDYRLIAFNQAHSDEFFRIYGHRVRIGEVFPDLFLPEQAPVMRGLMERALAGSHSS